MPIIGIPISGVTLGSTSSQFGVTSLENTTDSFAPEFIDSLSIGRVAVFREGEYAANLEFNFTDTYSYQSSLNIPFPFGDLLHPVQAAGLKYTSSSFGNTTVVNAAKTLAPFSIDDGKLGTSVRIWNYVEGGGGAIDFHFIDNYIYQTPLNIPYYFGEGLVISGAQIDSGVDEFGLCGFENTATAIYPVGIAHTNRILRPRVGAYPDVNFYFVDSYTNPIALNAPYYFGDGLITSGLNIGDTSSFGVTNVVNNARTVAPLSIDEPALRGSHIVYDSESNGATVNFVFVQTYNPGQHDGQFPNSLNIPYYFAGIQSLQTGWIYNPEFGIPLIYNFSKELYIEGFDSSFITIPDIEQPDAFDITSYVFHPINDLAFGEAIFSTTQYASFFPGKSSEESYGENTFLSFYYRYVNTSALGIDDSAFGVSWISHSPRDILPDGHASWMRLYDQLGVPNIADYRTYVEPQAIPSTSSVNTNFVINTNEKYVQSVTVNADEPALTLYGDFGKIYNHNTFIKPYTIDLFECPTINIRLDTNYLVPFWYDQIAEYEFEQIQFPKMGTLNSVTNRNKTIRMGSIDIDPYFIWGNPTINNNARIIAPDSIAEEPIKQRWESDLFVAFSERILGIIGLNSLRFPEGPTPIIYNDAFAIYPTSIDDSIVNRPIRIFDPLQNMNVFQINSLEFGTQWVSASPRYIDIDRKGIPFDSKRVSDSLRISNYVNYLETITFDSIEFGNGWYREHFNIMVPPAIRSSTIFGNNSVINNTPQLYPIAIDANGLNDRFGKQSTITHHTRTIKLDFTNSINALAYVPKKHIIENRNRTIYTHYIDSLTMHFGHDVYLTNLPIDFDNFVYPSSFWQIRETAALEGDIERFGSAEFRGNALYVEGFESLAFGSTDAWYGGFDPYWSYPSSAFNFGTPIFVVPIIMKPSSIEPNEFIEDTKHSISPLRIWCTLDTEIVTEQAITNNGNLKWRFVDDYEELELKIGAQFGTTKVYIPGLPTIIKPHSIYGNSVSGLLIQNKTRYIRANDPQKSSRFGYPVFPYDRKLYLLGLAETIINQPIFIQEHVPYTQYISINSLSTFATSTTNIELLHRRIYPYAFEDNVYGNNNPTIHFPRTLTPIPLDATEWFNPEKTTVGHYIRYLNPEGFENFTTDYDPSYFNDILRIRSVNFRVGVPSIEPKSVVEKPMISLKYRKIIVYQIPNPRCLGMPTIVQEQI